PRSPTASPPSCRTAKRSGIDISAATNSIPPPQGEGGRPEADRVGSSAYESRKHQTLSKRPFTPHPASLRSATLPFGEGWSKRHGRGSLLRRRAHRRQRIVVEDRHQPALGLLHGPALAPRVVLHLVALDLPHAEVVAVGMAEIEAAHRGPWPHGK